MDYCPPNSTLSAILHGSVNRCFTDTLTDPFLLVVSLLIGFHQYRLYYIYSTPLETQQGRSSFLYCTQLGFHFLIPLLTVGRFLLLLLGYGHPVYGVEILNLITGTLPWVSTGVLVRLECTHQLPVSPRHGHGPVLLIYWTLAFMQVNIRLSSLTHEVWWDELEDWIHILDFTLYLLTYLATCLIFMLGFKAPGLLPPHQYAGFGGRDEEDRSSRSAWTGFGGKIVRLLPYIWPSKSPVLQLRVLFCFILLVGVRVINVYVPIYSKKIIDSLSESGLDTDHWPWQQVSLWILMKFLQGGGTGGQGVLNNWRSLLWIRVQQYTTLEIQICLFSHIHNLSLRWHLGRKTGEVFRIMDRGTGSVNSLLQYIIFNILPTLVDILVAVIYLGVQFNVYFALILFATMGLYLGSTVALTEWRTKFRRKMNEFDNKQRARGVDSLLNAETVKYYSMEQWEVQKYKQAISDYQGMEWQSMASLQFLNFFQNVVISGGLCSVSLYCAYLIASGSNTVGDFTLLGTYFAQLMAPLNFLGSIYMMINESFINMENMFDLLDEDVEIKDEPTAVEYVAGDSPPEIEFREVSFRYQDSKPVIDKVSFTIPTGTSTAVVGVTGGGKSTLAKLLFRLFDVMEGGIYIDSRKVKEFTQVSLRSTIGVVPQDTVLFNDTIRYNIAYGRIEADQEEVEEAAKMADIHQTILGFPDGYETIVGERGLKLSGGEKQRIAIARTLLKNPKIIIFDEATSSLDTETERNIQAAIESASKQRTSFIVAHRLSTVMRCDQILVLDQGRVVERGTHVELLELGGKYHQLWTNQIETREETLDQSDRN